MNIQWLRLKPVIRELRQLRSELSRIADCLEADLHDRQITVERKLTPSKDPPELFITDELEDYVRDMEDEHNRATHKLSDQEE